MNYKIQKQKTIKNFSSQQRQQQINFLRAALINQHSCRILSNSIKQIKSNLQIDKYYFQDQIEWPLKSGSSILELLNQHFWQLLIVKFNKLLTIKISENWQKQIEDLQQNLWCLIHSLFFMNFKDQIQFQEEETIKKFNSSIQIIKYLHMNVLKILLIFVQNGVFFFKLWSSILKLKKDNYIVSKYIKFFVLKVCQNLIDNLEDMSHQNKQNLILCIKQIVHFQTQSIKKFKLEQIFILLKLVNSLAENLSLQLQVQQVYIFQVSIILIQQILSEQKLLNSCLDLTILIQFGSRIIIFDKKAFNLMLKYVNKLNIFLVNSQSFLSLIQKNFNLKKMQKLIHNFKNYLQRFFNSFISNFQTIVCLQSAESYHLLNEIIIFVGNLLTLDCQLASITATYIGEIILRIIVQLQMIQSYSIFVLNLQLKLSQKDMKQLDTQIFHILIQKMINNSKVQIIKNGALTFLHFLFTLFLNLESEGVQMTYFQIKSDFLFEKNIATIKIIFQEFCQEDIQMIKTCSDILQIRQMIQNACIS